MSAIDLNYRYLNQDGQWSGFKLQGLEQQSDGSLTLAGAPALKGATTDLSTVHEPTYSTGIAVSNHGAVYFTSPGCDRLMCVDACDGSVAPVPCVNLNTPRGLTFHEQRNALMICEAGARKISIYEADTWELLETRGGFELPVDIAVDAAGNSYVADAGTKCVYRFSASGDADTTFNEALLATQLIQEPAAVAVFDSYLYVLDTALLDVLIFDAAGQPIKDQDVLWEELERPCGLAVTADSIYVGDNARRTVLRYQNSAGFRFSAEAVGFKGPVAALAIDANGAMLVNTGVATQPLSLMAGGGFARSGILTGGPFEAGALPVAWHSLHAGIDTLEGDGDVQLFVFAGAAPPMAGTIENPFPAPWKAAAPGVSDLFVGGAPALHLWVGAILSGNGITSPRLRELKVRFNQKTYLPYLPAVYANTTRDNDFLVRLLALFESFNANTEDLISRLPELIDEAAVPHAFLPWLATWLAVDLDQQWSVGKQRQAIADAYQRYATRGTVDGLREVIAFETGVEVMIDEPIQDANWWVLPATPDPCGPLAADNNNDTNSSVGLGFSTMLSSSIPQGAVVGSTAILDRSRIIAPDDVGMPLFDEVAHRFTVIVPGGGGAAATAAVASVVDREKPAHTTYHICHFEPRMSVGFQARVGIDSIIGGRSTPARLDQPSEHGGLLIGGEEPLHIGKHTRIGNGLRL